MATIYEQFSEASLLLELLPSYVPVPVPGAGVTGLTLTFGGTVIASPLAHSQWASATADGPADGTLTRQQMADVLKVVFKPVPRMIDVAVADAVFGGQPSLATPTDSPAQGQTLAKLVEVLPE